MYNAVRGHHEPIDLSGSLFFELKELEGKFSL
jgi:hypothetical protein